MKLRYSDTHLALCPQGAGNRHRDRAGRPGRAGPTDPWSPDTDLPDSNPLGKVPALQLDDGTVLFDSRVICEYLDSLHDGAKLFPEGAGALAVALRLTAAIADGICDAAINRLLDTRRPDTLQSADWQQRQKIAMARACDLLEAESGSLDGIGDHRPVGRCLCARLFGSALRCRSVAPGPTETGGLVRGVLPAAIDREHDTAEMTRQ